MSLRCFLSLAALVVATGASAKAGVITGHLVDSQGNPVANAIFQLDLKSGGGGSVTASGAFTDANGNFTTTVSPDGDYRMIVFPPAPPVSTVVTTVIDGIVVGPATNNIGTKTLQVGTTLTGRVVNVAGTPLVEVGLGFVAPPDDQPLDFTNPDTNALGRFTVAVPYGPCTITFKPGPVPYYGGPGTAPTTRWYNFTGPVDAGTIVMPTGYTVSGVVLDADSGSPVEDAEVRAVNTATGETLYTPENRTSASGTYMILVPAGTYDFHVMPRSNDDLIPATIANRTVPPAQSLGTTQLQAGMQLKGKARNSSGNGLAGVTVSVTNATTGAPIYVADNVTTAGGNYKIVVPTGTFDVRFAPPIDEPLGTATVADLVVNGNTQQDVNLPAAPFFTNVGSGIAGTNGLVPTIFASGGAPRIGNLGYAIECANALGASPALFESWIGTPPAFPTTGVLMQRRVVRTTGLPGVAGVGTVRVPFGIANSSAMVGQEIRARFSVRDFAAPHHRSMTNELRATIAP